MVAEGNSSDAPPCAFRAILSRPQKSVFYDKLWGVADMPAILFPL